MNPLDYLGGMSGQAGQDLKLRQINIKRAMQGLPPIRSTAELQPPIFNPQVQTPNFNPHSQQRPMSPSRKMNPMFSQLLQLLNR